MTKSAFAFPFITVTFEFVNISASDLGLTPSLSSLALDKHSPFWSEGLGQRIWMDWALIRGILLLP